MEGSGYDPGGTQLAQAYLHFFGCPIGEGESQDGPRVVAADSDTVGDTVGDGPGLAGASTRHHAHGPGQFGSHPTLFGVKPLKDSLGVGGRQGDGLGPELIVNHGASPLPSQSLWPVAATPAI